MMKNWTIRFKLSLLYLILVSIAFLVFAFALYGYFGRRLYNDLDAFLGLRADGIIESIKTYWQTEGLSPAGAAAAGGEAQIKRIEADDFARIARTWVDDQAETPPFLSVAVQIFGPDGGSIAASSRIDARIRLSRESWERVVGGEKIFETVKLPGKGESIASYRVLTQPVWYRESIVYIVQVVSSLRRIDSSLSNLSLLLFSLVPIVIIIASGIVYYLTRSTLLPIQRMIDAIHRVREDDLRLRLDIPASGRELRELAFSFNSMLDRVEASFETQARFFNDVSHQLKTPLAVLRGELETTLKRVRSREEYEQTLESNLEEVDRMARLVNRMLVLARFDAGQVELKMEELSLSAFVESAVEDFRAMALAKNVRVEIIAGKEVRTVCDRDKVAQVLAALVENAIDHSPENGTVEIAAGEDGAAARLQVRDHGPGIPEDEREKIFDRFYRGTTAVGEGFGIGLSMARSIMRLHSGDATARNADDGGAIFTLSFPAADSGAAVD